MKTVKFLYSYGGKIIPRPSDGKLRYVGGYTRVLAVDRSITYSELMAKFGESCGSSMNLKCKLPSEDLDVLISVKSDEDLRNVLEEYERASPESKIRAVLFPLNSVKKVSPPSSPMSCFDFPSSARKHPVAPHCAAVRYRGAPPYRCCSPAVGYPMATSHRCCHKARSTRQFYHVPHRDNTH